MNKMNNIGLDDIRQAIHTYRPPTHLDGISAKPSGSADLVEKHDGYQSADMKVLVENYQKMVGVSSMLVDRCNTAYTEIRDMKMTIKEFESLVDSCREREHRHISALMNQRSLQEKAETKINELTHELSTIEQKQQDRYNALQREYQENKRRLKQVEGEAELQKSYVRRLNDECMELKSRMTLSKSEAEVQELSLHHRKVQDENLKLRDELLSVEAEKTKLEKQIRELIQSNESGKENAGDEALKHTIRELEQKILAINKEKHSYVQYCSYLLSLVDAKKNGAESEPVGNVYVEK